MATKAAKNSRTSRASSKKKTSKKSRKSKVVSKRSAAKKFKGRPSSTETPAATERFLADLSTRGEAQELDEQGKLPLDATHAIVGKDKEGKPIVRRARFKAY
jgi:hypothetical protein